MILTNRPKSEPKKFPDMTCEEQGKFISDMLNELRHTIQVHIEHAPDRTLARRKCTDQVLRFLTRVNAIT